VGYVLECDTSDLQPCPNKFALEVSFPVSVTQRERSKNSGAHGTGAHAACLIPFPSTTHAPRPIICTNSFIARYREAQAVYIAAVRTSIPALPW